MLLCSLYLFFRQGDITLKENHVNNNTSSSWTSWGIGLVKTSVAWSWSKVMSTLAEVEKGVTDYVVPAVLEVP